jgi:hypothetical protein
VLPIYPQSHKSPRPPVAPARTPLLVLLVFYGVAGAVSGAIDSCIARTTVYAREWCIDQVDPREAIKGEFFIIERRPPGPAELAEWAAKGLCAGSGFALILWIIASALPAARHPVRAGAMCASLGGTFCLILLALDAGEVHARNLIALAVVVVLGAIFGFLTSWLTIVMERVLGRFVHHDGGNRDS